MLKPVVVSGSNRYKQQVSSKRGKELRDRAGYLSNMWYAAALSEKVGKKDPVKVELCGKEMVLFRSDDGTIHCIDNTCPHRGAPLSEGWVEKRQGENCLVCPYHGWAFSSQGEIRDVPALEKKGEWPKIPLIDVHSVVEKGGFVWLFYGSDNVRDIPPIPFVPELEDPTWKATYAEIEFQSPHFSVLENGIDFAHIFYLHNFGNTEKPEIKDLNVENDSPFSVTGTFDLHNRPVNVFWALFQVPKVHVWAKAFLPCSSVVTFTLGGGLSFSTFVSTTPISKNRTINRFALIRKLDWDKTGLFNSSIWDGLARDAMLKIQNEDKGMVEQLKCDQLPVEYNVRADLFQVAFRKLRQQWVDLGYLVPTEDDEKDTTIL
jgi:phenylpropionate dioxygenase-like ring-hydroxylating dioxygenase large terminal subunit